MHINMVLYCIFVIRMITILFPVGLRKTRVFLVEAFVLHCIILCNSHGDRVHVAALYTRCSFPWNVLNVEYWKQSKKNRRYPKVMPSVRQKLFVTYKKSLIRLLLLHCYNMQVQ